MSCETSACRLTIESGSSHGEEGAGNRWLWHCSCMSPRSQLRSALIIRMYHIFTRGHRASSLFCSAWIVFYNHTTAYVTPLHFCALVPSGSQDLIRVLGLGHR